MNIKNIIDAFEKNQKYIEKQLYQLKESRQKETSLFNVCEKTDQNLFTNDKVIDFLADSLQLTNNEDDLKLHELEDIQKIYELLVQHYPDNIQYQEDLIAFVYNVMDNENKAKELIHEAMNRIESKRQYFKNILDQIK